MSGTDTICAEVFGGDGSAGDVDGTRNGKDNTWRYFLPVPACVSLDLLFDLDVSTLVALPGDALQYTITGKNLATTAHTGTTVSYCYESGEVTLDGSTPAGTPTDSTAAGCPDPANQDALTWDLATLDPGEDFSITLDFTAVGGGAGNSTIGYAVFTSNELPAPGFQTRAFTVIESLGVPELAMTATPSHIATPSGTPVTYSLTIDNGGTGPLRPVFVDVTIPTPFSYAAGTTMAGVTGLAAIGDPTALGGALRFDVGSVADIPPGGTMTLTFDATVPAGTADGIYPATVETWLDDVGWGDTISDSISNVAEVVIGAARSETPTVDSPILAGSTEVCGTTTEADGTTIRVLVAGIEVATTTSTGGS
ncbi:MAG: hypothetical protein GWN79_29490, partial [Actinobacteria bacterium]|nr:hypothetical protein [Actinomycetota bacterium]NIS37531.1 hypothetical protein [Actinomycetota bacterium]NIU22919.1 hypothetical protein [Actinomycetota bacterium]NIU71940.1 hypothetical protein [Actinomycetota bacterium]NIV59540.1 hypothetical protein [Actinomycetota bacterium]